MSRLRNAFICLALLPFLASAGTITTWTGNTDPQWIQATNWDNGLPGPGSDTRILNAGNNPVTLATAVAVDALTTGAANSLLLQPGAVLQAGQLTNAGSVLLAGGTLTLLAGPSVNSGSIQTSSGSLSQLGGNITNTGTIGIADSSALQFTGGSTYTNNGTIALNSSGTLLLTGSGTVTLTGNGSLTMGSTSSQISAQTSGLTLVNDTAHSITGSGVFGAGGPSYTLDNRGTVTATGAGMVFAPSVAVANSGTIQATGGPVQFINGAANTGGTIRADGNMVSFTGPSAVTGGNLDVINGGSMLFQGTPVSNAALHIGGGGSNASLVNASFASGSIDVQGLLTLSSSTITGSTVTNSGSIQTASGGLNRLDGNISNTGTIGIANGSALEFTGGSTYTNNGTIALNSSGALLLTGSGTVTLTGNGSLTMGSSSLISAETSGLTLVNDTAHSITGSGVVGGGGPSFTLDNRGTVTATGAAGLIFAPSVAVLNSGTIQATGGPVQFINGAANTGGTIRADGNMVSFTGPSAVTGGNLDVINNGDMVFQGTPVSNAALHIGPGAGTASLINATFTGGSIDVQGLLTLSNSAIAGSTVTNSGSIQTASGGLNRLDGNITNTGTIGIANSSALEFTGGSTYTNNGTIALNSSGTLLLTGSGTVTLTGNGSLTMGSTSSQIGAETSGLTLVNDTAHSITGSGVLGGGGPSFTLDNRGTVTATGAAGLIFAPSVAVVNSGTIQATGGPVQFINGAANTGGTIRADGNIVSFTGPSAVTGGNLDVINNGDMVFQGTPVSNAALHIGPGAGTASLINATFTGGSIDVQGLLTLASSAIAGSTVTNPGSIQAVSGLNQLGGNITNTGTIGIANGSALEFTGGSTYTNNGTIALNSSGALLLTGSGTVTLTGNGSLTMGSTSSLIGAETSGLTLVNDTAHSITGSGVVGGGGPSFTLDNRGTVTATGAGMIFAPSVAFQNNGVLAVNAGSQVFVVGSFGNFAAQTLTGGTYALSGTFQFMNADIVTNAADITLDGAGRIIDQSGMDGLRNFAVNSGTFTAQNGAVLPSLGQFTNSGSMTIGAGTTLHAIDYTQTDGATVVNGTLDSSVTLDGGSLSGTGHVTGSLANVAGSVNPGNSPGALYVDIDYDQGIAGILNMEIAPGGFDQLFVGGTANLNGTLNILLASGFAPAYGQTFDIMQYSSFSGAFANVNLPNPWSVLIYGDHELTFEYLTPEPATWMLFAGGLGLILRRRVRRG